MSLADDLAHGVRLGMVTSLAFGRHDSDPAGVARSLSFVQRCQGSLVSSREAEPEVAIMSPSSGLLLHDGGRLGLRSCFASSPAVQQPRLHVRPTTGAYRS
jgi:hypothetical protein